MSGSSKSKEQHEGQKPSRPSLQRNSSWSVVPTVYQQQPSTSGTSTSVARASHSHVGAKPMHAGPTNLGQVVSATTTTTTTTTTHQTSQPSTIQLPSNVQPSADALTTRLQNLHNQQASIQQRKPAHAQESLSPPVASPVGAPQNQQQPLPQPLNKPRPAAVPDPTPLATQAQNRKYPVTVEMRTAAFLEWQSLNAKKSQRAINRIKADYNSGGKDKEIYHAQLNLDQAQQAQTKLQLRESVEGLARKQQKAAREERRRSRDAERKAVEQQVRQTQQNVQLQKSAQELDRRLQQTINRQKREERRIVRETLEQQKLQQQAYQEQAYRQQQEAEQHAYQQQRAYQQQLEWQHQPSSQQQLTQNSMNGAGACGNFGGGLFEGIQTLQAPDMAQIVTQLGVGSGSGKHRRKAIAEGPHAVQQLENRIQTSLSQLGVCPTGFQWIPTTEADGYMCCGGNHFISDHEIDRFLTEDFYIPMPGFCNVLPWQRAVAMRHGTLMDNDSPLKRPPDQLPSRYACWRLYEDAKAAKDLESIGQVAGPRNAGMGYGF